MVEVTEADRIAAAQLIENYWHGDPSKAGNGMRRLAQSYRNGHTQGVWATAFATHREAAAKAERDRLRDLPDDAAEALARWIVGQESANAKTLEAALFHRENWKRALPEARAIATALADALEKQP